MRASPGMMVCARELRVSILVCGCEHKRMECASRMPKTSPPDASEQKRCGRTLTVSRTIVIVFALRVALSII